MRVGVSCVVLKPQSFGVDTILRGVVRGLVDTLDEGDDPRELVLFVGGRDPLSSRINPTPSKIRTVRTRLASGRLRRILWEQLALPAHLVKTAVDVVHLPSYVAPQLARVPTVVTVHDLMTLSHPRFCRPSNRLHHGLLLGRSLRTATRLVTVSDAVRRQLLERCGIPAERVRVIRPALEPGFAQPLPHRDRERVLARLRLSRPFALWVGNLEPKKNVPGLLRGFAEARRRGLPLDLVLVGGEGWGAPDPRCFQSDVVRWLGYVPRDDLRTLYQSACLLIVTSLAEGFCLPVLEALASGLPVVTAPVPAIEVAPDAVRTINPEDPNAIAEALLCVAEDGELRGRMAAAGRASAAQRTWSAYARELWNVYREAGTS